MGSSSQKIEPVQRRSVRLGRSLLAGAALALPGTAHSAGPEPRRWSGAPDEELEGTLTLGFEAGRVPVFRAAAADRLGLGASLQWTPHPVTSTWVATRVLSARYSSGAQEFGPEGLELGARLRPLSETGAPVDLGIAWWARLPLSRAVDGVASPASDLSFALELGRALGPARVEAGVGLEILGNPLYVAEQDDRIWLRAGGLVPLGPMELYSAVYGTPTSPRNPAQGELVVGVDARCPSRVGAEVGTGLSPAGPDLLLRGWVGLAGPCRARHRD